MDIFVTCYAGYRSEETPRYFRIEDREIIVREIISQWKTPGKRHFKIMGDDCRTYVLCHDEEKWILTGSD